MIWDVLAVIGLLVVVWNVFLAVVGFGIIFAGFLRGEKVK
jgi:hypothetical protein